jgi:RNA polymerase sigma factor (sigma-70 family)
MHNQHKYKHRQSIDEIFCELVKTVERTSDESFFIYELYQRLLPEIKSIARRYLNLDHALELDDLLSEAYLAIYDALLHYRNDRGQKFSTYVYWYFQKRFENLCCKDKVVVVKDDDDISVISYKEFQKIKRSLEEKIKKSLEENIEKSPNGGIEWTVESRMIPFEPFDGTNGNPIGIRSGNNETEDELLGLLEELDEVTCCSMSNDDMEDFRP